MRIFDAQDAAVSDVFQSGNRFSPRDISRHGELMGVNARVIVQMRALNARAEFADAIGHFFREGDVCMAEIPAANGTLAFVRIYQREKLLWARGEAATV